MYISDMFDLNIALIQMNPTVGDLAGNAAKMLDFCRHVPQQTDLIVFPELAICGYPPEDLILRPSFLDAVDREVETFINDSADFAFGIILPCTYQDDGNTYNALHLVENGEILGTIKKHQLPNHGVFDEMRVFKSSPVQKPLEFRGKNLGIMICEDIWHPPSAAYLKDHGAEILIVPNASPFTADKHSRRLATVRERVQETGLPVLYLNQVCGQDDLVFDGGSFIMNGHGDITHQAAFFEEDILTTQTPRMVDLPGEQERIYGAMTLGMRCYVRKNGFSKVVLGLSGGVDSALVATIAVDALGANNVHVVMMPSPFTAQDSLDDAAALATNLGLSLEIVRIEDAMRTFERTLYPYFDQDTSGLAHQNMQSRIRGLILMAISNSTGAMVMSTGNKSEMAVGYATLYGDMNGGYNVLKDAYKMQVYALCRWRNEQGMVIPERILTKPPSAELKDDQIDQDSLPPYEVLDAILYGLVEENKSVNELVDEGFDKNILDKVWGMVLRSEYKRQQAPPGPKVSNCPFDRQRRYPITSKFR